MNIKIPLDLGFCDVFTGDCSGERTPTGAVRMGLRPGPHRPRGESGIGARTVFTATSDRVDGLPREHDDNGESANVTGNRGGRRVRPGPLHLRVVRETGTCWSVRRARGNPQPADGPAEQPGTLDAFGQRAVRRLRARCTQRRGGSGAEGTVATPTGLSEVGSVRHQDRGLGQPGQRDLVPRVRGRATGVESEKRHRPPRRKARRAM